MALGEKSPAGENSGMNLHYPLISIITASLNQGKYIIDCIESVLRQEYPAFEHIVIDGGSTDNTLEILKKYPHLKWISEPDRGQSHAINKGLRVSRGRIVAYLNSDDYYYPDAFFKIARVINPSRGKYVASGDGVIFDEKARPYLQIRSRYLAPGAILDYSRGFSVFQPSTFLAREVLDRAGYLNEDEHLVMDVEWFARINVRYAFWPIHHTLAALRLHPGSKTFSHGMKLGEDRCLLTVEEVKRAMRPYWKAKGRLVCAWYLYRYHWGRWMMMLHYYLEWRREEPWAILKYFCLCILTKPYIILSFWIPHWIGSFLWGYRRQIRFEARIRKIFSRAVRKDVPLR